jgi:asparagine synthase (glutamine-hydrolysing)
MCGICGIVGASDDSAIERMTRSLAHRGPDDAGIERFPESQLHLGHRRLSIIDLSERGRQPMTNEDRSVWITFNGELYNFRELKARLDTSRHQFRSETDTEVILHLYEEHGADTFTLLNGMFAFALYDSRREVIYLVRDQLGIKPLYYCEAGGKLIFGSEIKAILASGDLVPEIDWQAASDFFTYLFVPSPQTIYRDVRQLPAAHWLEYDLRSRRVVRIKKYWSPVTDSQGSTADFGHELRSLLGDAVTKQMVSDVPLGAFLSGGIDSNVIVGLMAENAGKPIRTFTVFFNQQGIDYYDERTEARRIAEKFGTEHNEIQIDLAHPEEMFELVEYFDQPFGNATLYLTYLLSRETRKSVTVALTGAGGDELFGGYPRYRAVRAARMLRYVPRPAARAALAALRLWRDDYSDRRLHRVRSLLDGLDRDPARQYMKWVYYLDEDRKSQLLRQRNGRLLPAERVLAEHLDQIPASWDDGNRFSFLDVETFLSDNLLEYSDKMSMASALELRVPFLDPRVVELAFRIPFEQKVRAGESKWILKKAFSDLIPAENLTAPKKGFNVPLGVWMRGRLDRFFDERMPRDYVEREGIFNYDYLLTLREEHRRGKRDNAYELFAVLMFDTWYRKYITGTLARSGEQVLAAPVTNR